MTSNGSAYRSRHFADAVATTGLRHIRTRLHTPHTNGKAERFIQASLREWTYAKPFHPLPSGRRHAALEESIQSQPASLTLDAEPPRQPYRQGQPRWP